MNPEQQVGTGVCVAESVVAGGVVADFAAAAREWAQNTAVVHNGAAMTYQAFAEEVQRAASRYRSGELAAVLVSHTPAVVEHLLGILHARAAYCPIDAALPAGRKRALTAALGLDRLFAIGPDPGAVANLRIETTRTTRRPRTPACHNRSGSRRPGVRVVHVWIHRARRSRWWSPGTP